VKPAVAFEVEGLFTLLRGVTGLMAKGIVETTRMPGFVCVSGAVVCSR
jgi:hypothetical protein